MYYNKLAQVAMFTTCMWYAAGLNLYQIKSYCEYGSYSFSFATPYKLQGSTSNRPMTASPSNIPDSLLTDHRNTQCYIICDNLCC